MDLFSWFNEKSEETNEETELLNAVGCLCLLVMPVDGSVTADEKQAMIDIIKNDEKFRRLSTDCKSKLFEKIAEEVNDAVKLNGSENLIAQKCNIIFDLGESEFALEKIKQIVNADGTVTDGEQSFLKSIGRTLRVPTEDSEKDKGLLDAVMSVCLIVATLNDASHEDELHMILCIIKNDEKFKQLSEKYKTKVFGETAKEVRDALRFGNIETLIMKKCSVIRNLKESPFAIAKVQQIIDADKRLSKKELKFIDSITKFLNPLYRNV